jgi:hypothetical protein
LVAKELDVSESMVSRWVTRTTILMCVVIACGCTQQRVPQKTYECVRIEKTPIVIDGKLDDAEWSRANVLDFVVAGTELPPTNRVEGRMMWDDSYLYVGLWAGDEDVWSVFTQRDDPNYQEDVLEAFIQPNPDDPTYYNFEINAIGTIYDAMAVGYFSGGMYVHRWKTWNCEGLKVATSVDGTVNDYTDRDRSRTLEMAIPFAGLPSLKGKTPVPGDRWKGNLCGFDYSIYLKGELERFTASHMTGGDFHRKSDFMAIIFVRNTQP